MATAPKLTRTVSNALVTFKKLDKGGTGTVAVAEVRSALEELISSERFARMRELGGLDALFSASGARTGDVLDYEAFIQFLEGGGAEASRVQVNRRRSRSPSSSR